tara:strand:+ start:251 stop:1171 length:921 start_codon:yes stop_codon:yes gene_type:complete
MKRFYFLFILLLTFFQTFSNGGFNYQALVRDASGNIKKNADVSFAFDILDQSDNVLYSETHTVTTNDYGIVNLIIGKGTTTDDFSSIDWTLDELSIKVTLDGTDLGTSPLLSVPYANYANNGITSDQADAITANTAKINYLDSLTSDIQTQLDAAGGASNVTFNQVRTTGFTDTDNVLEIGDLVIRVNENYLEWKVNSGEIEGDFYATVTIRGSLSAVWNSMNSTPNVGDHNAIKPKDSYQQIVDITDIYYTGGESPSSLNNPGLWYYKMVEIELINNSYNESYKITAYGNGLGKVTIKGEYWNFK